MIRGWRLTFGLLLVLVAGSLALRGGDGDAAGLGVPALLFPAGEARAGAAEDLADRGRRRLDDFLAGGGAADSLVLEEEAVEAVVRDRLRDRLPAGVADVRVELRGPTAAVSARIRFAELETGGQAARRLSQFLGDSARVELELEPSVAGPGDGRLTLLGLRAGGLTLPSGLLPFMLSQLGMETRGQAEPTVSVRVPRELTAIDVGDGRLVLSRSRGS